MFNIILFNPQIPPNTGNIMRLCVNTNSNLFLIEPLGFNLDQKNLRRAKLDYNLAYKTKIFKDFKSCYKHINKSNFYFVTKYGEINYSDMNYKKGDTFIFGSEISGLPKKLIDKYSFPRIFIPMYANSRSINLCNAVSICVYEGLRQNNFFTIFE